MADINKLSRSYAKQGLYLTAGMFFAALIVMQVCGLPQILVPLIVSVAFSIMVDTTDAIIWRKVAKKDATMLPTFYTSVSGFRMLLALAVMFVYYLAAGRGAMLVFFLVFMAFYVVLLVHHTAFFMRVSKHS